LNFEEASNVRVNRKDERKRRASELKVRLKSSLMLLLLMLLLL
jgi:hypothetical protein